MHLKNYASFGVNFFTLVPKLFDYQFTATLDWRGQGIRKIGIIKGGRKGYQCYQNYHLIHSDISTFIRVTNPQNYSILILITKKNIKPYKLKQIYLEHRYKELHTMIWNLTSFLIQRSHKVFQLKSCTIHFEYKVSL